MFRQLNFFDSLREPEKKPNALQEFPYQIEIHRRAYARRMRLVVQASGRLKITVSKSTPLSEIREFVESRRDWIDQCLASFSSLRAKYPEKQYVEGEKFWFQGRDVYLHLKPEARCKRIRFFVEEHRLVCEMPLTVWESDPTLSEHIRRGLRQFYAREGERVLTSRVSIFAQLMGLAPRKLSFRSQKTRWGSCTLAGHISLNWRLIAMPSEVADYVVVHELAHLRHYDHSSRFWALVETQIPRYRELRRWLKQNQYEADFLAAKSELY